MASNFIYEDSGDGTITFDRPLRTIYFSVAASSTFSFSLDGSTYMSLPSGFHKIELNAWDKEIYVRSNGDWQFLGVQAP